MTADGRTAELAAALTAVRSRIARTCNRVGRDPAEVTVIAVTKTWPAADVRRLASLGIVDVGESRDQEAAVKAAACGELRLRWHFVGRLQRNKCRSLLRYVAAVHSVDRPELATALDAAAVAAGRRVEVTIQVSLDPGWWSGRPVDPGRGGAAPQTAVSLADAVAGCAGLRLAGVMAVAPRGSDPDVAFGRLAEIAAGVRQRHPAATWLSAGMSGDFEAAVAHGATHVRIGAAVLGGRAALG
ncbi:MAG: YggS family pyridoxal phosphate-dependent enzyme [Actinomycetota bacterium]|nr:MAG: YggS family pyridoxal phosphate-dependent enzyme [Actinomycetota bacterium]